MLELVLATELVARKNVMILVRSGESLGLTGEFRPDADCSHKAYCHAALRPSVRYATPPGLISTTVGFVRRFVSKFENRSRTK